jgi:hypothetical protein
VAAGRVTGWRLLARLGAVGGLVAALAGCAAGVPERCPIKIGLPEAGLGACYGAGLSPARSGTAGRRGPRPFLLVAHSCGGRPALIAPRGLPDGPTPSAAGV